MKPMCVVAINLTASMASFILWLSCYHFTRKRCQNFLSINNEWIIGYTKKFLMHFNSKHYCLVGLNGGFTAYWLSIHINIVTGLLISIELPFFPLPIHKMTTIFTQNDHFFSNLTILILFLSHLEINHVIHILCRVKTASNWNEKSSDKTQCARTDLNKRFLHKPMTTTGWKETP